MTEASALERLLRRDRLITAAGLTLLCVLAWVWIAQGAGLGMSAWSMTRLTLLPHEGREAGGGMPWSLGYFALVAAMWWVMMVAMMTPSAAPAVLLYARIQRQSKGQGGVAPAGVFAGGYLLAWLAFSLLAAGAHWLLEQTGLEAAMGMGSQSRWLSAGVLVAAGVYQLSPLHRACLTQCRAPAAFIARHWRPGLVGAVRLGALHGAWCVGCCGLLMALLFVGGVMNLAWIAGLTLLVMLEKLLPAGRWVGRAAGHVLVLWGVVALFA